MRIFLFGDHSVCTAARNRFPVRKTDSRIRRNPVFHKEYHRFISDGDGNCGQAYLNAVFGLCGHCGKMLRRWVCSRFSFGSVAGRRRVFSLQQNRSGRKSSDTCDSCSADRRIADGSRGTLRCSLVFFFCLTLLLTVTVFSLSAFSFSTDPDDYLGFIEESLNAEEKNLLPETNGVIRFSDLGAELEKIIRSILPDVMKMTANTVVILLLSALFRYSLNAWCSDRFEKIGKMCSSLAISLLVYSEYRSLLEATLQAIERIRILLDASASSVAILYAIGGNGLSASVSSQGTAIMLGVLSQIASNVVVPLTSVQLASSFVGNVSGLPLMRNVTKTVRNATLTVFGILSASFSAVISLQHTFSQSADSACARTFRFALGKMIPVVGSSLSEATRTISAGISYLRTTVGIIGIAAVIILILIPFLRLFLCKLGFWVCGFLASVFGMSDMEDAITDFSRVTDLLLAVLGFVSVNVILLFVILLRCTVSYS